jgi:anti-anti-sigma factor
VNQTAPILVGHCKNKVVWIRVDGKGSFLNAPQIKEYAQRMIAAGEVRIVVDLENCPVMDSTFMGTLSGIARELNVKDGGRLEVINANQRNQDLITGLGLNFILDLDTGGDHWPEERAAVSTSLKGAEDVSLTTEERTRFLLRAHEELTIADKGNIPKFQNVIDCLKQELEKSNA